MSKVTIDINTLLEIQNIADKLLKHPHDVVQLATRLRKILSPYEKECNLLLQSTAQHKNVESTKRDDHHRHHPRPRHLSLKHINYRRTDAVQSAIFSTTTTATGLPKEEPGPVKTKILPKLPKDKSPISTPVEFCNGTPPCECFNFKNRGRRKTCPNLPETKNFSTSLNHVTRKKYLSASTECVNGYLASDHIFSINQTPQSGIESRDSMCFPHSRFEPCQISIVSSNLEHHSDSNNHLAGTELNPIHKWDHSNPIDGSCCFPKYHEDLLNSVYDWNFQIFELADKTEFVVSQMAYKIFQCTGLFETFKIPKYEFVIFMKALESGYKAIPYHNKFHAADVLHGCWFLTTQDVPGFHYHFPQSSPESSDSDSGTSSLNMAQVSDIGHGSLAQVIPALELMALYLAAAMHDYDHPGKTNAFLVETRHPLANTYNDRSVLENHHASASWKLLYSNKDFDFLRNLETAEWKRLRFLIVEAILATDLKKHFNILSQFLSKAQLPAPSSCSIEDQVQQNSEKSSLNWSDDEHRLLVCQMVIKLADISGPTKVRPLHITWTKAICEEFFLQGDVERDMGMPVSPFMDKEKPQVAELQRTFINNLITPVLLSMHRSGVLAGEVPVDSNFYDDEKPPREQNLLIEHLKSNLRFWKTTPWKNGHEEMQESFKYARSHKFSSPKFVVGKKEKKKLPINHMVNGTVGGKEEVDSVKMSKRPLQNEKNNRFNYLSQGLDRRLRSQLIKNAITSDKNLVQTYNHVDSARHNLQVETIMTSR